MQSGKDLAEAAVRALAASSKTSATAAGPSEAPARDAARVDAINQVFALFRLNYHNQYYRAYEDAGQLAQAKKLWLDSLAEFPVEVILLGARGCIEGSEYLPTLARMRECCDGALLRTMGLPDARAAYREACLAPEPRAAFAWSHPAVWHAACATGWSLLSGAPEKIALPAFERHYAETCRRLRAGEQLALPAPPETASHAGAAPDFDRQRAALRKLREDTGL
jgi:hypothetical protein